MDNKANLHENFKDRHEIEIGSERNFGLIFALVFSVIGIFSYFNGVLFWFWFFAVAIAFLLISLIVPVLLKPFNFLWFKLGIMLQKIVSPIVLATLFFFFLTPIAVSMRIFGKCFLDMKFNSNASTYWIERKTDAKQSLNMTKQY